MHNKNQYTGAKVEVKNIITDGHNDLHKKIDSLHESQQSEIDEIRESIYEPIKGLISRQEKTETYIKNAKTGLMWLAGIIGTEIIALIGYFKEKIIAFFH